MEVRVEEKEGEMVEAVMEVEVLGVEKEVVMAGVMAEAKEVAMAEATVVGKVVEVTAVAEAVGNTQKAYSPPY